MPQRMRRSTKATRSPVSQPALRFAPSVPSLPAPAERRPVLRVAVLVGDSCSRDQLRTLLGVRAELVLCSEVDELLSLLAKRSVDMVVVPPWDSRHRHVAPVICDIRARFPSMPVAVYCSLTADAVREIVPLAKAGADEVIIHGSEDRSPALWSRLLVSASRRAADQATVALHPFVPAQAEAIVSYCVEHADSGVSVAELAAAFHVHRRTLVNRMASAGMPAPSTLISWSRLLVAALLLEDRGRPVEQVAFILGFSSGAALRNMLRRYTDLRPSELRAQGGFQHVVGLFQKAIESTVSPRAVSARRRRVVTGN